MRPMKELQIGELSRQAGVSLRTLRFYEQIGIIKPRRDGETRLYSPKDQIRLALIQKGKRFGFTLSEIAKLIGDESRSDVCEISLSTEQIEAQIDQLSRKREEIVSAIDVLRSRLALLEPST